MTQVSTHIYMCDDLGEDVQDELGNEQAPVKYTVRVATVGTAVSMLQNAQSVISTVRKCAVQTQVRRCTLCHRPR